MRIRDPFKGQRVMVARHVRRVTAVSESKVWYRNELSSGNLGRERECSMEAWRRAMAGAIEQDPSS